MNTTVIPATEMNEPGDTVWLQAIWIYSERTVTIYRVGKIAHINCKGRNSNRHDRYAVVNISNHL